MTRETELTRVLSIINYIREVKQEWYEDWRGLDDQDTLRMEHAERNFDGRIYYDEPYPTYSGKTMDEIYDMWEV